MSKDYFDNNMGEIHMGKYIYVDNSNVWIEGKYVSAVKNGMVPDISEAHRNKICNMTWAYDFGKLLKLACDGDISDVKRAVLYGSKPTDRDSLWNAAKREGFEVVTKHRNYNNQEKAIDSGFDKEVLRDLYKGVIGSEDEVILVAGDMNHMPVAEALEEENKGFKLVFWNHASNSLKNEAAAFIDLNEHLQEIER